MCVLVVYCYYMWLRLIINESVSINTPICADHFVAPGLISIALVLNSQIYGRHSSMKGIKHQNGMIVDW